MENLSAAQARRVFLHAQGLDRKRPSVRVNEAQFRSYLQRQGVLQLDSVNVLARAHYLPVYSRFGPYDQDRFDRYLWSSGEVFEHWGHEASIMPLTMLPLMRHRMQDLGDHWGEAMVEKLERRRPGLLAEVERAVQSDGPLTAADLAHLEDQPDRKRGSWWDLSDAKRALEYLFITGRAAVAGRPNFQRLYADPASVWGSHVETPGLAAEDAQQRLFDHAIAATGIGALGDLADHFRIKKTPTEAFARSAVERGVASWVQVEGWKTPALLAAGAHDPGRATGAALLSPFDPVCWYRDRLQRMFAMHYRIEIYTPAAKRQYGYYTLPFLLGDQIVARVDLKADRKASTLRVQAAWLEEGPAPGARKRTQAAVSAALAVELRLMARWLGLEAIVVEPVGTLAGPLREVVLDHRGV